MMRRLMMGSIDASFRPESLALFARITTPPTVLRKVAINTLISSLVAGGVWDDLDALYVMAAADSQAAQLNWKSSSYTLGNSGATFTADRGYMGDGTSAYLTTGYAPGAGQFGRNDHSYGVLTRTTGTEAGASLGVNYGVVRMEVRDLASSVSTYDGASTGEKTWSYSSQGLVTVSRTDSSSYDAYRNGSAMGNRTEGSEVVTGSQQFLMLAELNTGGTPVRFSNGEVSAAHLGKGLSSGKVATLSSALSNYMTAVGA